ncbi:MAG: HDOD domain-containing protein [Planctomycetota bacterium]|nr:HDOD domain-containing protein [Planctomycetota bacterium]
MTVLTLPDPQAVAQQAVKKISSIAALPEITTQIVTTVEDPKSNASHLHHIVSHDPALVTRILKVVNSAFYGLPGQIASIERAIVLLGFNAIKNIAVASSLGQLFRGVKLGDDYTAKDLWIHCVAVGVTARELARQMRLPLADEAFLAGMIHDVGLLVSLQVYLDHMPDVCQRAKTTTQHFCDIERQLIGTDHQCMGAALCEQWKFPRSCQLVAGYHHHPTTLHENNRLLVTLVHVADTLCCQAGQGFSLTAANQQLEPADLAVVGLEMTLVEQVRTNLPTLLSNAMSIFQ